MGYQHIPVDALAAGQSLSGGTSNALVYLDGSGLLATVSTLAYSATPGFVGIGTASPTAKMHLSGAQSCPSAFGTTGVGFASDAATWTDTVTSGTTAVIGVHTLGIPTLAFSSASTGTNVSTLYIAGAPAAGTNATLTNAHALHIAAGNIKLGALNMVLDTTTGTKIGTATTQKLAFYNSTPVVQPATAGTSSGFTAGGGTTATHLSTFTGGTGSAAYTVGDIVLALKTLGLMAA